MSAEEIRPGIPKTITREAYMAAVTNLGIDYKHLRSLEWRPDGIYAEVYASDVEGRRIIDTMTDEVILHRVYIEAVDE